MSTISSYILRQTMGPLLMAVAIALLVLLTERMLRLLDLVLDTGGGLTVLLQMLAFLVPHYMALALPVAFFLGVLLAFSGLHQNRELDALGSAGIGLRRLVSPVVVLAVVLTVVSAVNFAVGQPYARYIYRALVHDAAEAAANVYLQERTFVEVKGVTFMAERIWRRGQEFAGIFIYEEKPDGKAIAMTAERGVLDVAPKGEKSTLFLEDGVRLESALPGTADGQKAGVLRFSNFQVPIDLVGQSDFRPRGEDERELTLTELWRYRFSPPEGVTSNEMVGEFHDRLVRSLSVLFLPLLAVPFALGPPRGRHSLGIVYGLIILIVYNQALTLGNSVAEAGRLSPLLGQWVPFAAMAVGSVWLFYRRAYRVPRGGGWSLPNALEGLLRGLRGSGGLKGAAPGRGQAE